MGRGQENPKGQKRPDVPVSLLDRRGFEEAEEENAEVNMSTLDDFRKIDKEELRKGIASGAWGSGMPPDNRNYKLAKLALKEKEEQEEKERFNRTLGLARDNVNATRNLVRATLGLVLVTALLVWITYIKQ